MFALCRYLVDNEHHLQKKSGLSEGILQESLRIVGTSAGIDQSAEPPASILGVENDDPTFFFARINSLAREHTYENQLRRGFAGYFLLFTTGPDILACLAAFVRNGHRHDIVLCRLTDLSIDSKPVGAWVQSKVVSVQEFGEESSYFSPLKTFVAAQRDKHAKASRYLP